MSDISKVKVKKPLEVILLQVIISGNNSNEPKMSTEQDNLLIVSLLIYTKFYTKMDNTFKTKFFFFINTSDAFLVTDKETRKCN